MRRRRPHAADGPPALLELCAYHGPYPGNFIPTLMAVASAAETRLGLGYHCVFPASMADRPWVELLRGAGIGHSFLSGGPRHELRELTALARTTRAGVIRSHFTQWDVHAGLVARRVGAGCIWHVHSGRFGQAPTIQSRGRDLIKVRLLGRLCDRLIAVSDEIGRLAVARGFPADRVRVVRNGIATSRFAELPSRAEARAALGIDAGRKVAVGFAWSPHTKGADVLVDAARPLGARGDVLVVLVGDESLRGRLGVDEPWLQVVAPRDDVGLLFAAADVFVSASREEGLPYSIGEAMASGLPVVSSDIPGPSVYFAAEGVHTFRSEDAADLRRVLEGVLARPDPAAAEANRRFVEAELGIGPHVDRVLDVVGEVRPR
jgi:glycosyltransferase involved in cell wall biosynthesis